MASCSGPECGPSVGAIDSQCHPCARRTAFPCRSMFAHAIPWSSHDGPRTGRKCRAALECPQLFGPVNLKTGRRDAMGTCRSPAPFRAAHCATAGRSRVAVALVLRPSHTLSPASRAGPLPRSIALATPLDALDLFSEATTTSRPRSTPTPSRAESDREGRIVLPDALAAHAGLGGDGGVHGHGALASRSGSPAPRSNAAPRRANAARLRNLTIAGVRHARHHSGRRDAHSRHARRNARQPRAARRRHLPRRHVRRRRLCGRDPGTGRLHAVGDRPRRRRVARGAALAARFPGRLHLLQGRFGDLLDLLGEQGVRALDGVVLDLGVSSFQIDDPARGFSFRSDGPLDMRMGPDGPTAADLVATMTEAELADTLFQFGEERHRAGGSRGPSSPPAPGRRSPPPPSSPRWCAPPAARPGRHRPGDAQLPGAAHPRERRAGRDCPGARRGGPAAGAGRPAGRGVVPLAGGPDGEALHGHAAGRDAAPSRHDPAGLRVRERAGFSTAHSARDCSRRPGGARAQPEGAQRQTARVDAARWRRDPAVHLRLHDAGRRFGAVSRTRPSTRRSCSTGRSSRSRRATDRDAGRASACCGPNSRC